MAWSDYINGIKKAATNLLTSDLANDAQAATGEDGKLPNARQVKTALDQAIAPLIADTHAHTNKALLDQLASHGGITIAAQTLTVTKTDGTTESVTLPSNAIATRPQPVPAIPDPATAVQGTVYVVADDGAYMVNDAADAMVRIADIATIETMTQAHIDAPDGIGRLVTPDLLVSLQIMHVVATQAEAEAYTVPANRAVRIGEGVNHLGDYWNISGAPQVSSSANRNDPTKFKPYSWNGSRFASADGATPSPDHSLIYFKDWSVGVLPEPPRERSFLYIEKLSHTKAEFDAMTTVAEMAALQITASTFYRAIKLGNGTLKYVEEAGESLFPGSGLYVLEKHNKYWSDEVAPDLAWLNANALPTSAEQSLSVSQYTATKAEYQALPIAEQDTHKPPVLLFTSVESSPGVFRWTEHESGGGSSSVPESVDSSDIGDSQLWQNADGQLFFKDKNGTNRGLTI